MSALFRLFVATLALAGPLVAAPVITEFCASNQTLLSDEDGDQPDWVEIHNPDATPVVLTGWHLTDKADDRTKWRFPETTLPAGGYLVVFASNKDRRIPGRPLHTNFALSASGEYLGLIAADGTTVVSEYAPTFPEQVTDVSYGIPSNLSQTVLVAENAACQWTVPSSASQPGPDWKNPGYSAAGWTSAKQGIGYDRGSGGVDYLPFIGAGGNVEAALGSAGGTSCYLRIPFTRPAGALSGLRLRVRYDDGFAVWLNGQPVRTGGVQLTRNTPAPLQWNSGATASHDDPDAVVYEEYDISENAANLVTGENVLSFQVLNRGSNSSDLLLQAELTAAMVQPGPPLAPGYFAVATPGAPNAGPAGLVIPQTVVFSRASGTFTGTLSLALSGATGGQRIVYTLDGSVPTAASALYSSPLSLTNSALVRARILDPATGALGFIGSAGYERLATSVSSYGTTGQAFRSALPIVVLNNAGGGEPANDNVYRATRIQIHDRAANGYASLATTGSPLLAVDSGVKIRGRSSAGFPKKSYGIEIRDAAGEGRKVSVLGMPAGEDWALIGGWNYDRAFMRNAWIYEVSRRAGRWAPRTRLVEVFFNQDGDNLEYADYRGVYLLCEVIRDGANRVDIAKSTTDDPSGGYIFKVDPPENDEYSWRTNRNFPLAADGAWLVIHRPKLAALDASQSGYLRNYFQQFENAAFAGGTGYRDFIDPASWADHNLFCALAKNVDGMRLSGYYSKDRDGKILAGPLWDFDRSVNSPDVRDDDPTTWRGTNDATDYHRWAWWQPLFENVEFRQTYVDRWQALRRGPLATASVNALLDGYLAEFKPADTDNPASRDYAKWYGSATSNSISNETTLMKNWLATRSTWIDGQFTAAPTIQRASGPLVAGQTVAITVPAGTTVYYTTDGSDPRAEGGGLRAGSLIYNGPVTVSATMRLTARAYRSGSFAIPATNWSGPVEGLFLVDETYATAAEIRVSAVNYHPLEPTAAESAALPGVESADFEWLELRNISAAPVNLDGLALVYEKPVAALTLPPFTLAAGARALIVKDPAAFTLRYGAAAASRIVASWTGHRALDNGGADIRILDRSGAVLADFRYDDGDAWPSRADGGGSALEFEGTTTADYANPAKWKSSAAVHGSPGTDGPQRSGIVVNELLTRSAADAVELFNPTATAVDIGGWYFSDTATPVDADGYRRFRIPDGTVLAPGGFAVFPDLGLDLDGARGGVAWLISADAATGALRNFEQTSDFGPVLADVPLGRRPDGSGDLVPLAAFTPAAPNAAPRIGTVQVSEIHYQPAGGLPEFVEIANTLGTTEPLGDWTLRGDVDFDFPPGFQLGAAEAVVLVGFDPAASPAAAGAFRANYGVPAGVRLIGPWNAGDALGDAAGTVRLRRRVPPPADEPAFVGRMIEDEVPYSAAAPWPATAGGSLHRLGIHRQAADPASWIAGPPDPGSGAGGYLAWALENSSGSPTADADGDGLPDLAEYLLGTPPATFTMLAATRSATHLHLDYTLRTDRDDALLAVEQSADLKTWLPAGGDVLLSTDGLLEHRRASLPLGASGFLRLRAVRK